MKLSKDATTYEAKKMNNAMLVPKSYVTYVSMCRDKVVEEE